MDYCCSWLHPYYRHGILVPINDRVMHQYIGLRTDKPVVDINGVYIHSFIHSFCSLSYESSTASSKVYFPHKAI
jgi:hypothetical protein